VDTCPVAVLVTLTVAPTTAAPFGSLMVPVRRAVTVCAEQMLAIATASDKTNDCKSFFIVITPSLI
jgi:hypothetical protein